MAPANGRKTKNKPIAIIRRTKRPSASSEFRTTGDNDDNDSDGDNADEGTNKGTLVQGSFST